MESVFWQTLNPVFGSSGVGFLGTLIKERIFHGFKGTEGIPETLDSLG
jgi:hypothetical protein